MLALNLDPQPMVLVLVPHAAGCQDRPAAVSASRKALSGKLFARV